MTITLRRNKGAALTHNELDDNFEVLDQRIAQKANSTHTHAIANITGLKNLLDNKIDLGDVNVPNGLLQLDPNGKVSCSFLNDCFDVASKANTADLIENGKIKNSLLPDAVCDCETIEDNIISLGNNKLNRLRNWRIVSGSVLLESTDDILILNGNTSLGLLSVNEGMVVKMRRLTNSIEVGFDADVRFLDESNGMSWATGNGINSMELIYTTNQWYQIG